MLECRGHAGWHWFQLFLALVSPSVQVLRQFCGWRVLRASAWPALVLQRLQLGGSSNNCT